MFLSWAAIPSSPMVLEMTILPDDIASRIFIRKPDPARSGTINNGYFWTNAVEFSTSPW